MSGLVLGPFCIASWIFTLVRLRAILRQGTRETGAVALNIWGMMLFFTITITFVIAEFAEFFDTHTFPNLALLVLTSSFLVTQYFGMAGILTGMEIPTRQRIIRWMRLLLVGELAILLGIYSFFVPKTQVISLFAPQSFPEVTLVAVASFLGIIMAIVLIVIQLVYFPAKKFTRMRLCTILMILSTFTSAILLSTRVVIFWDYIWRFPLPSMLMPLTYISMICATVLFFCVLLSNRIYAQFVATLRSIESWRAFRDLKCLVEHLLRFCPVIGGMSDERPRFWAFLLDPEYYLYRAVIVILDSNVMLADFLANPDKHPVWEDDLLREALRINQALQLANQSNELSETVNIYRRISQDLFASQKNASEGTS